MKYTAKQYSQALMDASQDASEKEVDILVQHLETLLGKQGSRSLLPRIVEMVKKTQDEHDGITRITVTTGPENADLSALVNTISAGANHIEVVEDKTIIAGARVLVDCQWYVDATLNHRLQKLSDQLHSQ